jgi:acyl dehydratase
MKLDRFTIGQVFQTKSLKLTKDDIIRFAGDFDPQYMHLDEEKQTKEDLMELLLLEYIH